MFENLLAEMKRQGITDKALSLAIRVDLDTWRDKISGKADFTRSEMVTIRNVAFPGITLDYLFSDGKEAGQC